MKKISCFVALAVLTTGITRAQDHPKVETFIGYTYTHAFATGSAGDFEAHGGSAQFVVNPSKHFGLVLDLADVHNGKINNVAMDTTFATFLFGPRFTLSRSRVRPYLQVLFGGVHASTSVELDGLAIPPSPTQPIYLPGHITAIDPSSPVSLRATASQTSFAMTAGGGLDIKMSRHVSFRLFGMDYLLTRMQNFRTLNDNNQGNFRLTTGLNFTLGGEAPAPMPPPPPPPPPPMKACWDGSSVPVDTACPLRNIDLRLTAAQTELCPGGTVTLQFPGAPSNATYQWTVEGQPTSKSPTFEFGATGRQPGNYRVGLTVDAPEYHQANAGATLTVRPYSPPTGSLQVSQREIWVGEKVTLSANFSPGQCGGTLGSPSYAASEGSIQGDQFDSTGVRFDPGAGSEQRKTVTIMAKVSDGKGEGQAQATVLVKKQALPKRLPDIVFPSSSARVNNCGKRVLLEELKAAIESDPTGKVVLVGHVSEKEAGKAGLDQQRALNAAAVLSAGQGVCSAFPASQIMIGVAGAADNGVDYQSHFCGSTAELPGSIVRESESDARFRRVEVWFVPNGGAIPATVRDSKDAASLSVSGLGCPK